MCEVIVVIIWYFGDILHEDGVQVGEMSAQVSLVRGAVAEAVDPVLRRWPGYKLKIDRFSVCACVFDCV